MPEQPLSEAARVVLERVSRVLEATPELDARTIRVRAGLKRERGDAALAYLVRAGFVERRADAANTTYRSARPYRSINEAPKAGFGATHSTSQGGG